MRGHPGAPPLCCRADPDRRRGQPGDGCALADTTVGPHHGRRDARQATAADLPIVLLADDLLDPEVLIDEIRRELRAQRRDAVSRQSAVFSRRSQSAVAVGSPSLQSQLWPPYPITIRTSPLTPQLGSEPDLRRLGVERPAVPRRREPVARRPVLLGMRDTHAGSVAVMLLSWGRPLELRGRRGRSPRLTCPAHSAGSTPTSRSLIPTGAGTTDNSSLYRRWQSRMETGPTTGRPKSKAAPAQARIRWSDSPTVIDGRQVTLYSTVHGSARVESLSRSSISSFETSGFTRSWRGPRSDVGTHASPRRNLLGATRPDVSVSHANRAPRKTLCHRWLQVHFTPRAFFRTDMKVALQGRSTRCSSDLVGEWISADSKGLKAQRRDIMKRLIASLLCRLLVAPAGATGRHNSSTDHAAGTLEHRRPRRAQRLRAAAPHRLTRPGDPRRQSRPPRHAAGADGSVARDRTPRTRRRAAHRVTVRQPGRTRTGSPVEWNRPRRRDRVGVGVGAALGCLSVGGVAGRLNNRES